MSVFSNATVFMKVLMYKQQFWELWGYSVH